MSIIDGESVLIFIKIKTQVYGVILTTQHGFVKIIKKRGAITGLEKFDDAIVEYWGTKRKHTGGALKSECLII